MLEKTLAILADIRPGTYTFLTTWNVMTRTS